MKSDDFYRELREDVRKWYQESFDSNPASLGPEYNSALDGARLSVQIENILMLMLCASRRCYTPSAATLRDTLDKCGFAPLGGWLTRSDISRTLGYPEASISAQLRHLRKPQFGGWNVEKRRRPGISLSRGCCEYRVTAPEKDQQAGNPGGLFGPGEPLSALRGGL